MYVILPKNYSYYRYSLSKERLFTKNQTFNSIEITFTSYVGLLLGHFLLMKPKQVRAF